MANHPIVCTDHYLDPTLTRTADRDLYLRKSLFSVPFSMYDCVPSLPRLTLQVGYTGTSTYNLSSWSQVIHV